MSSRDIEFVDEMLELNNIKPIQYEMYDVNGNRINGPEEKVFARKVVYPSGNIIFEILTRNAATPYDPLCLTNSVQNRDSFTGKKFELRKVSETKFNNYLKYLQTKMDVFFRNCEREIDG